MLDPIDLAALRGLGLQPQVLEQLYDLAAGAAGGGLALMRVVEVQRTHLGVHDGQRAHVAPMSTALARAVQAGQADAAAVGDWALVRRGVRAEDAAQTEQLLPARNCLTRRNRTGERQTLVANVDTGLLVMGLDGDYNLRRLERYLALLRTAGVPALVLLTKADLHGERLAERLAAVRALLRTGDAVEAVDGRDAATAVRLAPWLGEGQTLVLLGSSGAGKSTLTGTLCCGTAQPVTGAVRDGDSRGRHTTTVRTLYRCPHGACVIDTPGLRALRLDVDEAALQAAFDDIAQLGARCRFRDCCHEAEPGCAVRASVSSERLRSYHKLQREVRRDSLSALQRQQQRSQWAARSKAARQRAQDKR